MTKREAIIQATIEVVAEKGVADSPTILLAKQAGAAEFTLFRLFGNKSTLLDDTYDEVLHRFHEAYSQADRGWKSIEDKLRNLLRTGVDYFRNKPEELGYILQYINSPVGEHRRPDIRSARGEDISDFPAIALLAQGKEKGDFKNLSITALAGLAIVPVMMTLRGEQIRKIRHSAHDMELLIDACVQGARA
jgi:TetR/AcrR family transcriptional regulator, repressor of fatR-cypB operon